MLQFAIDAVHYAGRKRQADAARLQLEAVRKNHVSEDVSVAASYC